MTKIVVALVALLLMFPAAAAADPGPEAPSDVTVSATDTTATIAWTESKRAVRYQVTREWFGLISRADGDARSYTWTGLAPCTEYLLGVRAEDRHGRFSEWVTRSVQTTGC